MDNFSGWAPTGFSISFENEEQLRSELVTRNRELELKRVCERWFRAEATKETQFAIRHFK
jgi:hypothetical protein